jgi:hypothetical protein
LLAHLACCCSLLRAAAEVAQLPPNPEVDRSAGWGADCGHFHYLDIETFLNILRRCPLHTRLALTTFVNKSFRMLRYEPELFGHISFRDVSSMSLSRQLQGYGAIGGGSDGGSICCPASHFANILIAKSTVVTSLSFGGGSTPLTAIKACVKAIGPKLTRLSLYGEALPNAATVKEIGKHCTSLTALDLSCGGTGSFDAKPFELALVEAVKRMPHLQLLRVPPMHLFETFLGDWSFVKQWRPSSQPSNPGPSSRFTSSYPRGSVPLLTTRPALDSS